MAVFKFPSLFKTPVHRKFGLTPRYYDERKERLEQLKSEKNGSEISKDNIRKFYSGKRKSTTTASPLIIRVVIVVVLVALLFWFLR